MFSQAPQWTRRHFSQTMVAAVAATLLDTGAPAQDTSLAFATSPGSIQVFRAKGSRWTSVHETAAASPAHIVQHPSLPLLYVLHDVAQWENLPRGAASAYLINPLTGTLTHRGTQPLSLSATNPRHAVITADGTALLVAAHSGGIYNQLPVAPDGALLPVSSILKQYGPPDDSTHKTSTPRATIRHNDGSIFSVDPGQETVSRFLVTSAGIQVRHRTRVHVGSGPSQIALSPNGRNAYVMHSDNGSIAHHIVGGAGLSAQQQLVPSSGGEMVLHPSGRFLLVAGGDRTQILHVDTRSGAMAAHGWAGYALKFLRFAQDGGTLVALRANTHTVVSMPFDSRIGQLGTVTSLATVQDCTSLHYTA